MNITLPMNLLRTRWYNPNGSRGGAFRPEGRLTVPRNSRILTPNWSSKAPVWGARLFVGFNVGHAARYKMDDLIKIVKRVRRAQNKAEDSSFLYQKGIYTHQDGSGTVTEDGAQVVFLNLDNTPLKVFRRQMIELANAIVDEMQQETVIIELQRSGIIRETIGVSPHDTELDVDLESEDE